jgi:hypothetical protein
MEGRQCQVQIGEDVVKIWVNPLELARETVEIGVRPARRFRLSKALLAYTIPQFARLAAKAL